MLFAVEAVVVVAGFCALPTFVGGPAVGSVPGSLGAFVFGVFVGSVGSTGLAVGSVGTVGSVGLFVGAVTASYATVAVLETVP